MKARLVVFPIRGRNWCFSRSIDRTVSTSEPAHGPSTLKDLWKKVSSNRKPLNANAELVVDFVSNKMNRAWHGLESAPEGTFKKKIHGLGQRLLARVKPSEVFLKSISKDVSRVEITYPSRLDARFVRRRLRHIAARGSIIHRRYLYGSVTLLPLTAVFTVLPLPNIPFFWALFRTYSHWRALQGSERLLRLISDCTESQRSACSSANAMESQHGNPAREKLVLSGSPSWVLLPSSELDKLIHYRDEDYGLSESVISDICKRFNLNIVDVMKYQHRM